MTYRDINTPRTEEQDQNLRELIELLEVLQEKESALHNQSSFVRVRTSDSRPQEEGQVKGQFVGLQLLKLEDTGDNVCGTTACAAGWTLIQKDFGFRDVVTKIVDPWNQQEDLYWRTQVKFPGEDTWYTDGKLPPEKTEGGAFPSTFLNFESIAAGYLGLTEVEADEIFYTMSEVLALQSLKKVLDGTFVPVFEEPEDQWGE